MSFVTFADIDKDGDLDLFITGLNNSDNPISELYTNDGTGKFNLKAGTGNPFTGVRSAATAFADIDKDGDLDLFLAGAMLNDAPTSELYTNDGTGKFVKQSGSGYTFTAVRYSSVAFADVDKDDDPDLLISGNTTSSGNDCTTELYTNDGTGKFTKQTGEGYTFTGIYNSSVAFADIDKDGDLDLLISGLRIFSPYSATTELYTNDGTGKFTKQTGPDSPFTGAGYSSVAFADIDKDSDLDLLITGYFNFSTPISELYTNDGTGKFTKRTEAGYIFTGVGYGSVAFADIDKDGAPDLLITGQNSGGIAISELYNNDGTGKFVKRIGTGYTFTWVGTGSVAFADIDKDSDLDFLLTGATSSNTRVSEIYTNSLCQSLSIAASPSLSISQGQTATLTASESPNNTYSWSTGQTTAAISASTAGTYSVTAISSVCSATASVVLTVTAPPSLQFLASSLVLCQGSMTSLTVVASGGQPPLSYNWQVPKGVTVSPTNTDMVSATAVSAGVYTLTVTVGQVAPNVNALPTSTSTISITVNASPSLTITPSPSFTILTGTQATFTASGADSFRWAGGETTAAISVSMAGTYSLTGIATNSCSATAVAILTLSPGPDLSPTIDMPDGKFPANGSLNFVVNLYETGRIPTTPGSVTITLTVPVGYSVSFDQSLTSIYLTESRSPSVSNGFWQISNLVGSQQLSLVMMAGQSIPAGASSVVGFTATRTTANSGSVSNITVNVADDATNGYDVNRLNNIYARIIMGL
ncbi:hypothetical protein GCM10028809_29330 [Spirosoma gilvum]